jgi:hypothetical protein
MKPRNPLSLSAGVGERVVLALGLAALLWLGVLWAAG